MLKFPIFKLLNEFIGEYLVGFSKEQLTLQIDRKIDVIYKFNIEP